MYLKNVVVTTKSGIKIELAYPKRTSKFEMEYEYVCDFEEVGLDKFFDVETKVVNYLNGEEIKPNKKAYLPVDKIVFVGDNGSELKFKALIKLDKANKDYSLSLMLVDRSENIVECYDCDLSIEEKQEIHEIFRVSSNEIKNRMESIDKLKVFFFVSGDAKNKKEEFLSNSLCLLKDTSETDIENAWKDKSYISKSYLEKLLGAYVDKKYGLLDIFTDTMDKVFGKSKFALNVDKIVSSMSETSNEFCEFTLASILVEK